MPKLEKIEFFDVKLPVKFLPRSNCYSFIYQLISPSGKVYIGQTQREVEQRLKEYKRFDCDCSHD